MLIWSLGYWCEYLLGIVELFIVTERLYGFFLSEKGTVTDLEGLIIMRQSFAYIEIVDRCLQVVCCSLVIFCLGDDSNIVCEYRSGSRGL